VRADSLDMKREKLNISDKEKYSSHSIKFLNFFGLSIDQNRDILQ
jgi:hypothetical protein